MTMVIVEIEFISERIINICTLVYEEFFQVLVACIKIVTKLDFALDFVPKVLTNIRQNRLIVISIRKFYFLKTTS